MSNDRSSLLVTTERSTDEAFVEAHEPSSLTVAAQPQVSDQAAQRKANKRAWVVGVISFIVCGSIVACWIVFAFRRFTSERHPAPMTPPAMCADHADGSNHLTMSDIAIIVAPIGGLVLVSVGLNCILFVVFKNKWRSVKMQSIYRHLSHYAKPSIIAATSPRARVVLPRTLDETDDAAGLVAGDSLAGDEGM